MEKNIKDFLPHYINHVNYRVRYVDNPPGEWTVWSKLTPGRYARAVEDFSVAQIEIELRKLESMTEEELADIVSINESMETKGKIPKLIERDAARTAYYLSKGFDLFNLIDSGLALEKQPTTLNQGV